MKRLTGLMIACIVLASLLSGCAPDRSREEKERATPTPSPTKHFIDIPREDEPEMPIPPWPAYDPRIELPQVPERPIPPSAYPPKPPVQDLYYYYPGGKITQVRARRIDDLSIFGDDEFEACVTFTNTGNFAGEYQVRLFAEDGSFIDKEPDVYWKDVDPSDTAVICVGTNYIYESISDLGSTFTVVLRQSDFGERDRFVDRVP